MDDRFVIALGDNSRDPGNCHSARCAMAEAEAAVRAGALSRTVYEVLSVEDMQRAHKALMTFLERDTPAGPDQGWMTLPTTMRRHIAVAFAALDAYMIAAKLEVTRE